MNHFFLLIFEDISYNDKRRVSLCTRLGWLRTCRGGGQGEAELMGAPPNSRAVEQPQIKAFQAT
jgi:hypothetical protein